MFAVYQALRLAAQAALGWVASDVYNEYQRSQQLTPPDTLIGSTVKTTKTRWWVWLIGFAVIGVVVYLIISIVNLIRKK